MAFKGRGGFYELYAQHFSESVDRWLEHLPAAERAIAGELAKQHPDYFPDREGVWVYDSEDNDIRYVTKTSAPRKPDPDDRPEPKIRESRRELDSSQHRYAVETVFVSQEKISGKPVDWLEFRDEANELCRAKLYHAKLVVLGEDNLKPGARIVCDLWKFRDGWHGGNIYRVADARPMAKPQL